MSNLPSRNGRDDAGGGERRSIAVVNDSREFLDVIREILEAEGYDVTICMQPTDVLRCVREADPDLLILDVRMAGVQDWVVLETLRADPELGLVPAIVCSAATDQLRHREAELRREGLRVIEKPFDMDELLAAVEASLQPRAA